jgi:uncharacterized protein YdhG (YjbR/CyaY superfamily)
MKKASASASRGSEAKASAVPKTVYEYLATIPEPARSTLQKVRAAIRSVVPAETTEVISYRIPAFRIEKPKYKGILVWYAAFSDHCSLFPTASLIKTFKKELKEYKISKGTIQFPVDKPLPAALVKKMVKARIAENERKRRGTGRRITVAKDTRARCDIYRFIPIDNFLARRLVGWFS